MAEVDVIVTCGPVATRSAKEATVTIPIVMAFDKDPVGSGFVARSWFPGRRNSLGAVAAVQCIIVRRGSPRLDGRGASVSVRVRLVSRCPRRDAVSSCQVCSEAVETVNSESKLLYSLERS